MDFIPQQPEPLALDDIYGEIIDSIVADSAQCVLLLGPELSVNHLGIDYRSYFKDLAAKQSRNISRYVESDNLFVFTDTVGEKRAKPLIKEFYANVGDPILLEMISRVRFPLIINVSPDIAINKLYQAKGIEFHQGFFWEESKPIFKDLPYPSKISPVVYNIFGSVQNDQSMIMKHGRLYETIQNLLPKMSLPNNLEVFLDNASSFIFLGFKYDSWYYQLICHKLRIKLHDATKTSLSVPDCHPGDLVSLVMRDHFKMDFTKENPVQVMERIIRGIEEVSPAELRPKEPHSAFSVYVSYARDDEETGDNRNSREEIVNKLEAALRERSATIQFFRDRNELTYGDRIDSFMTRIGKGKTVIRVISDKYLKSRYCMDEALRIKSYNDADKRIFTIVLNDVVTPDENNNIYKAYWQEKCTAIFKEIDTNIADPINRELLKRQYGIYLDIYGYIDSFLMEMNNEIHLRVPSADGDFDRFIGAIISKIEQD